MFSALLERIKGAHFTERGEITVTAGCWAAAAAWWWGNAQAFLQEPANWILSLVVGSTHFGQWLKVLEWTCGGSYRHQGCIVGAISGEIKDMNPFWSPISEGWWWETEEVAKSRERVFEAAGLATQQGCSLPQSFSDSFCLVPLFLIHRRAEAFAIAKVDFWQLSLWKDMCKREDISLNQSLSLLCSFLTLCFSMGAWWIMERSVTFAVGAQSWSGIPLILWVLLMQPGSEC